MNNGWAPQTPYSPYSPYERQVLSPITQSTSLPGPSSRQVYDASVLTPPAAPRLGTIPLPPMAFDDTVPNPLVSYSSHPPIEYDVRRHPFYASASTGKDRWTDEPATNPPTPEMVIVCMPLPRPFIVHPASRDFSFVTVRDVLAATHVAFREAAQESNAGDESWVPGFPMWCDAPNGRYKWAGLSEQIAPNTWLLHTE